MYFEDVLRRFADGKLKYVIAGGIAVNLHGVPRMTYDLDIAIDLVPKNIARLFAILAGLKFKPKHPIRSDDFADEKKRDYLIEKKGMRVLSFWQDGVPVREIDVLSRNLIPFSELWKKRINLNLGGGLSVPLIGMDHLIAIKRIAGRKQDVADIESLRVVKRIRNEKRDKGA